MSEEPIMVCPRSHCQMKTDRSDGEPVNYIGVHGCTIPSRAHRESISIQRHILAAAAGQGGDAGWRKIINE